MLWCCLQGGANDVSYLKPVLDFYGYKKFAYYVLGDVYKRDYCALDCDGPFWEMDSRIKPVLLAEKGRYSVRVLVKQEEKTVFEKTYVVDNAAWVNRLGICDFVFKKAGYYTIELITKKLEKQIKEKFIELTGLDEIAKNDCPLNLQIESKEQKDGYTRIRFTFDSEVGERVPCYLLIPNTNKDKYPVVITLQGHSTGFHNSIGEEKYEWDKTYQPRGAFALQAVENGFIALAIEQCGMGIRKTQRADRLPENMCQYASRVALGLGRTILGERVWDVHKAIDALAYFTKCDLDKILITGNSGGGHGELLRYLL